MQLMELAILNGTYRDANIKSRKEPGAELQLFCLPSCFLLVPQHKTSWSNNKIAFTVWQRAPFFFNASVKQCPAQFYFMPTYQVWVCKFTFLLCVEVVQEMYYPVNYPVKTLNLLRYYLNLLRYYIMQETKSWKFFFKKSHFKCLNEVALLLKSFLSPCLHVCTHVVFWVFLLLLVCFCYWSSYVSSQRSVCENCFQLMFSFPTMGCGIIL